MLKKIIAAGSIALAAHAANAEESGSDSVPCTIPMKLETPYAIENRVLSLDTLVFEDGALLLPEDAQSDENKPVGKATFEFEEFGFLYLYANCDQTSQNSWYLNGNAIHLEPTNGFEWQKLQSPVQSSLTFEGREDNCIIKGLYMTDDEFADAPEEEPMYYGCEDCLYMDVDIAYKLTGSNSLVQNVQEPLAFSEEDEFDNVLVYPAFDEEGNQNEAFADVTENPPSATLNFREPGTLFLHVYCPTFSSNSWFINGEIFNFRFDGDSAEFWRWVEIGHIESGSVLLQARETGCYIDGAFLGEEGTSNAPADDESPEDSGNLCEGHTMHVEFYRRAPKFKVYPCENPFDPEEGCRDQFAKIRLGKIVERNSDGKKVRKINNIAKLRKAKWSYDAESGEVTMVAPLDRSFINQCKDDRRRQLRKSDKDYEKLFNRWLKWWKWHKGKYQNDATITLIAKVYEESVKIEYGEDNYYTIPERSVKVSVEGEGWGLCDEGNTLDVYMSIKTVGVDTDGEDVEPTTETAADTVFIQDDFVVTELQTPKYAFVDDAESAQDVNVFYRKKGIKTIVKYQLPYFSEKFVYDPSVAVSQSNGPEESGYDSNGVFVVAPVAGVAAVSVAPGLSTMTMIQACVLVLGVLALALYSKEEIRSAVKKQKTRAQIKLVEAQLKMLETKRDTSHV